MALDLLTEDDRIDVKDSDLEDLPDPDAETAYVLRPLTPDRHREIQKRHTKHVLNRQTGRKEPKVETQDLADDLLDYVLVDWSGIVHKGKALPCEREYKLRLDFVRKSGLLAIAGLNQSEKESEAQAASFRQPS